jgi:hypothetical protein
VDVERPHWLKNFVMMKLLKVAFLQFLRKFLFLCFFHRSQVLQSQFDVDISFASVINILKICEGF